MDDITTLYVSLDNDICMKFPEGLNLLNKTISKEDYSIKLNKSLYWLKQSRCMWYNYLSEYLLKEWYRKDHICPSIYMKILENEFA